jgi:hypothetical protein
MRTIVKLALWHAIPAVAASLIMSTSHAQASFGVRGGANRAKMTAKDGMLGDVSNRSGFEAGIAFGLPIAQWITLAPELGYVQRGYHREATPPGFFPEERLVLDYADLALLARIHPTDGDARPFMTLGATVGRLMGARLFQTYGFPKTEHGFVLNIDEVQIGSGWSEKSPMSPWNVGLCVGLGFAFTTGTSQLLIEGRYRHGLTNIWNGVPVTDEVGNFVAVLNGHDRSISATLAWLLPMGKPSDDAAPAFK